MSGHGGHIQVLCKRCLTAAPSITGFQQLRRGKSFIVDVAAIPDITVGAIDHHPGGVCQSNKSAGASLHSKVENGKIIRLKCLEGQIEGCLYSSGSVRDKSATIRRSGSAIDLHREYIGLAVGVIDTHQHI